MLAYVVAGIQAVQMSSGAPTVTSLEGASRHSVQPRSYADGAGQVGALWTAVDRETARCRCYGHAEGTTGEGEPSSGGVATVTSSTGGEARPRRPLASLVGPPSPEVGSWMTVVRGSRAASPHGTFSVAGHRRLRWRIWVDAFERPREHDRDARKVAL
jgi:hypothetical protein